MLFIIQILHKEQKTDQQIPQVQRQSPKVF